jgi:hypothetical protein
MVSNRGKAQIIDLNFTFPPAQFGQAPSIQYIRFPVEKRATVGCVAKVPTDLDLDFVPRTQVGLESRDFTIEGNKTCLRCIDVRLANLDLAALENPVCNISIYPSAN